MMDKSTGNTGDLSHKLLGGLVFLVSLVVYLMTVQRTLSLWDCGEFVACSYILGVAHPPGTPLFLLIGRVFSILPLSSDIALRVNLLSVFSSAAAAMVAYLVAVRLLLYLPGAGKSAGRRLALYLSAATGALLFAFSRTNWSNSVEAEVYALAMLLTFLIVWLSLRWYETRGNEVANRYLILIAYLSTLSIGIHMTVFLVMPAVFLFLILADESLRRDVRFWVTSVLLFLVAVDIMWFFVTMIVWLVISLFMYLNSKSARWALALLITAAALVGYSSHAYVPIRAAQKPSINENNPDNLQRFRDYISRRQYGNESMLSKMFHRRALWANQFGEFPRIGFGGFLLQQYGLPGIAFLLPLVLALTGIISLIKWKWKIGVYVAIMLLLFTIGLVLYMNFADGSRIDVFTGQDKLEVRDRDYFFTPGFILFGLCIGLGVFVVIKWVADAIGERTGTPVGVALGLISLLLPVAALSANFHSNDRSGNYVPYDYAYNLLMTCPQDAILFTNGDNDTFPVWCLQEVYGIRKDVRVINLSLLQIDWYQLQMKYEKGVPISFDDDHMTWVEVRSKVTGEMEYRPNKPYYDPLRKWSHPLAAFQDRETGKLVTVAHLMIENIISTNNWKYPILFANSYPSEVAYPLAEHVIRRGTVYELVRERTRGTFDRQETFRLLEDVYRYRGLDDPEVYREEVATSLVIGDAQTMMEFADELERSGDTSSALSATDIMIDRIPELWQPYARKGLYLNLGTAGTDSLLTDYFAFLDKLQAHNPDNIYYHQYRGMALQYLGRLDEAIEAYEKSYQMNRALIVTYRSLLGVLMQAGRYERALDISREFLKTNPGDPTATAVINQGF